MVEIQKSVNNIANVKPCFKIYCFYFYGGLRTGLDFLISECKSGKASLIKANILDSHCDKTCIDYVKFAIDEDMNSRIESLNKLTTYYAKYGMVGHLSTLDDYAVQKINELKIFNRGPNYMENLFQNTLTKEVFDHNLETILSIWQDDLQEIRLVSQKITPKHIVNCYILKAKNNLQQIEFDKKYSQTFQFLDNTFDDLHDKHINNYYSLCSVDDLTEEQLANIDAIENSLIYTNKTKNED